MDLSLLLESLLKRVDGVLKVPFLVFVLLLDVRVDLDVLDLLVFHVRVQVLVDSPLELVEVIDELNRPVHGIRKSLYEDVVGSDLRPILLDQLLHMLLARAEVIDNIPKVGIDLVVMLQVLVHLVCLFLETGDFHLARRYISLELLDLIVEHKFELLQLLSLLL